MNNILAWAKSNWIIVVLSAVVLASLPAGIVVSSGMNKGVQEDMQKRVADDFGAVSKDKISYTIKHPLQPGKNIVEFSEAPNTAVIKWFEERRGELKSASESAWEAAYKFNRADHKVRIEGLFPLPDKLDDVVKRTDFTKMIVESVPAELLKSINAGTPPEADKVAEKLREQVNRINRQMEANPDAKTKIAEMLVGMRIGEYQQRAGEFRVYADPTAFANFPAKVSNPPPPLKTCWELQEALWVYEDLCRAIADVNSASGSAAGGVPGAVVKRVISLAVEAGPTGGGNAPAEGAAAPKSDGLTALLNLDPGASLTGRISGGASGNQLYDVKIARMDLVVSTYKLPELINALARTNFFTVIGCDVSGDQPGSPDFDLRKDLDAGYYYGSDHVVRVSLQVEAILFRDWTREYMPAEVKAERGVVDPVAPKGATPAPAAETPAGAPPAPKPAAAAPAAPSAPKPKRRGEDLPD